MIGKRICEALLRINIPVGLTIAEGDRVTADGIVMVVSPQSSTPSGFSFDSISGCGLPI